METWLPLIAGLVMLVIGGELLVRGAVKVASNMGVSPLVIGLTLVGFGTSTPELVTSVQAALSGAPGIALGNIVDERIDRGKLLRLEQRFPDENRLELAGSRKQIVCRIG